MAWQQSAKKKAAGKWIKFGPDQLIHVLTFEGEPQEVEKVSTIKGKEGEKYTVFSFPVTEEGEDRILEPNMSLLRQILAEDEIESIMGRTLMIKVLDPEKRQNWMIRPVGDQKTVTRSWSGEKKKDDEPIHQTDEVQSSPVVKSKGKFVASLEANCPNCGTVWNVAEKFARKQQKENGSIKCMSCGEENCFITGEEEKERGKVKDKEAQDDKNRAKFKDDVKKRAKKVKEQEQRETQETQENEPKQEQSDDFQDTKGEMEQAD